MKILCILACVLGILSSTAAVCKPDLGLVVDITRSLQEKNVDVPSVLKKALTHLVEQFDISEDKTHVSLETFSKKGKVHNKFNDSNYWSVKAVIDLINSEIPTRLKPVTRLDRALEEANLEMFTRASGDRPGDRNALVLLTDGRTNPSTENDTLTSAIEDLKNKGVLLIAVAIGPDSTRAKSQNLLKQIAGENVISVTDYNGLDDAMDDVVKLICCKRDLGLVVDITRSLQEKNVDVPSVLKEALTHLVEQFDISEDITHVSLETFSKNAKVHNKFNDSNYWSVKAVIDLIKSDIPPKLKPVTRLDRALEEANLEMFTEVNGDRPGARNALVLLTDGRTNPSTNNDTVASSIADLKNKDVFLVAVAIGDDSTRTKSQNLLKQIAGKNVFDVPDYLGLDDVMDDVFNLICR